jgi:enoyl-CoA hydratase/carnithine racemase
VGAAVLRAQRARRPDLATTGVADQPAAIPPEAGLRFEVRDAVAYLTLERPGRLNSQTPETWIWLGRALGALPGTVRAVVVRGAGRAFSAGLDKSVLASFADARQLVGDDDIERFQAGFNLLARPDVVTIAAVHGHAIGAGFQLALACDLRIVARDALFAMAEVGLGLVPDLGGTKRLVELVGYSRALDICVSGRSISADEAMRLGLANAVVAVEELDATVDGVLQTILAKPRTAVIEVKALLAAASGRSHRDQQVSERAAQLRLLDELMGDVRER